MVGGGLSGDRIDAVTLDRADGEVTVWAHRVLDASETGGPVPLAGLRLRGDVVGDTPDGLAKAPDVREARRIRALRTVTEQDIAAAGIERAGPE